MPIFSTVAVVSNPSGESMGLQPQINPISPAANFSFLLVPCIV